MPQKWWVLAAVACGTFMATLDSSVVNIALPTLTKAFGTDLSSVRWVVIVYLLVITCLLLPFGRLSDQHGRKRFFQSGFLIFTVGSLLCGLSNSLAALLISRGLQGVGASMMMANGPAVITSTFPSYERGQALGILAMVVSAGLVTGPGLGGYLVTEFGWQSIFILNLPIGILGNILVYRFVAKEPRVHPKAPFDWVGALLQMVALLAVIVFAEPATARLLSTNPNPVMRLISGGTALVLGLMFIRVESSARAPLLDLSLLRIRTFWTANLAGFLNFVAYASLTVLMPFFMEEVLHFGPKQAGAYMTAIPLTIFVVAPISGRLSDRFGGQELSFVGALIGTIGLFFMAGAFGLGIHEGSSGRAILFGLCSMGLATGLFQSPNNNAMMSAVPTHKLGVASAQLATIRNLGMVAGTGLATSLSAWHQQRSGDFVASLHFALFVAGIFSMGAMVAALGKQRGPASKITGT